MFLILFNFALHITLVNELNIPSVSLLINVKFVYLASSVKFLLENQFD